MIKITKRGLLTTVCALSSAHMAATDKITEAVCVVPVADLVGEPLSHIWPHKSVTRLYQHMPSQAGAGNYRISQLLFNERVHVLDEICGQALISVEHQRYCTDKKPALQTRYWVLKNNVAPIRDQAKIPEYPGKPTAQKIVALIRPLYDTRHARTYSFGTRFVVARSNEDTYVVWTGPRSTMTVPHTHAITENHQLLPHEQRSLFVTLLRTLASAPACVEYVWGGASWVPATASLHGVPTGFDCSALVMRAAQTAGIYFPWRNSCAIGKNLAPLGAHEHVETGDILWIPGHVMVIGDIETGTLIEARTASHGYGCVQEIPLNKQFRAIDTIAALEHAVKSELAVERLDARGKRLRTTRLHVLRLPVSQHSPGE